MARQRQKSINDIIQQHRRIERQIIDRWPMNKRLDRINDAQSRYIDNIRKTKGGSMSRDFKVSRSVYMGLTNG